MARRQSLLNRILIAFVTAFGLLNLLYSGYLVNHTWGSFNNNNDGWNGLEGFAQNSDGNVVVNNNGNAASPPPPITIKYVGMYN